ncbi:MULTISPECIES: hypothetical protein [unclassified Streptomyces]|uniref:hypothetical protein n=1 Tax=unclassified Streptomyces TaxID=2593676 RepID=UPI00236702F7|nr:MULTISPECIES: hypothetical protein [unclassified Streptomyces]MDF3142488.1 hypothetical protein [Streptomyces sp. T21Q-yed]WDF43911.1 hypothetical protein PBV52_47575 [Streptomyces sp. T12]
MQTATAGWAAGFIGAIAMYFQMRGARAADRRMVLAGHDERECLGRPPAASYPAAASPERPTRMSLTSPHRARTALAMGRACALLTLVGCSHGDSTSPPPPAPRPPRPVPARAGQGW